MRLNESMLKEGAVFVMPNGFELVVGKRIVDEYGPAIEVTDERGKKYVKDVDNFLTWLRGGRAKLKVANNRGATMDRIALARELTKLARKIVWSRQWKTPFSYKDAKAKGVEKEVERIFRRDSLALDPDDILDEWKRGLLTIQVDMNGD